MEAFTKNIFYMNRELSPTFQESANHYTLIQVPGQVKRVITTEQEEF